ncbi:MAG: ATP-binding cassette domain-containing protein [Oscillospiraceae bacterium]|jgi:putative phosphonate transport system ATP-binding protein|nr:ATP-binding cassette domain-containing protein [Oscillospiraceae bacterium]
MNNITGNPAFALELNELTVRYGPGCPSCGESPESLDRNRCPVCGSVWAVRGVSLRAREGETLGIVGESGSGKSTLMRALHLDEAPTSGAYFLDGGEENLFGVSPRRRRYIRDSLLGMVYQNPYLGLRMFFSSGANVAEKLIAAGSRNVRGMTERAEYLFRYMEIPFSRVKEPPRNFSGGMQQRVQIAKAVANNPPVLLLDEVTTGLDLSVQARVLDLIKRVQREFGVTMIVVSHDLAVVRLLADRTAVMRDGVIIEQGLTDRILEDPRHVYTQTLVNSML